jgi:glycine/D-amino acid oxidase-like deaminating enzyme
LTHTDLIVVGAGLAGSATAWVAARRGMTVTVLEAFRPGHANGSSHGSARIFRRVYSDPLYVEMAGRAGQLWRRLEEESGETIITTTGGLDFGPVRDPERLYEVLRSCHVEAELVPPGEAAERWPGFRFDGLGPVLFHPEAGALDPDRAMAALLRGAAANGADIRFGTPATSIEATATGAVVRAGEEEFTAPVAVIAVGAWLEPLAGGLVSLPPLTVTQEQILHLPQRAPSATDPWPSFIYEDEQTCFYGLLGGRDGGVPGAVKIGEHHAGKPVTAATRDFAIDPANRDRVLAFSARHLPGLAVPDNSNKIQHSDNSNKLAETTCLYTTTVNEDFILDRQGPLVIASPCSGHGAKFAPLLGEIIVGLAQGRPAPDPRFTLAAHRAATARTTHALDHPADPGRDDLADRPAAAGDGGGGQFRGRVGAERLQERHRDRGAGARVAVVDLQRRGAAVGERERVDAFCPGLEQQPRDGDHKPALVARPAAGPLGELAHRVGHLALRGVGLAEHERAERPGHAGQGQREDRRAAPVDAGGEDGLTGEFGDDMTDVPLQRVVQLKVGIGGPVVEYAGGEHRGVLARAVEPHPGFWFIAFPDEPAGRGLVAGQRRRALQVVLG